MSIHGEKMTATILTPVAVMRSVSKHDDEFN